MLWKVRIPVLDSVTVDGEAVELETVTNEQIKRYRFNKRDYEMLSINE